MTAADPRFHLNAPDNMDDVLLALRLGDSLLAAGLGKGDRFTYSQQLEISQVEEAAAWGGLHIIPDGSCTMIVVRPTPKLPRGSWAVNLNHLGGGWPTMGRIVGTVPGNWVKLRPYDIHGEPLRVIEPLDARWLARICTPNFPLDGLVVSRTGHFRRIGDMGMIPWSRADEAKTRNAEQGGMDASMLEEEKSLACWMAADPLLCRAFQRKPGDLLRDIGLMTKTDADASEGFDLGRRY